MKRLLLSLTLLLAATGAISAEHKPLQDIVPDQIFAETQITPVGTGDHNMGVVWWVPLEFWKSHLARSDKASPAGKKAVIEALTGVSVLAILQADIRAQGAFDFYPREEIESNMIVSYTDSAGHRHDLRPIKSYSANLEKMLDIMKPMLSAAAGNLGQNFQFFVLSDIDDPKTKSRLVDPYQQGSLVVSLKKRDGQMVSSTIELPLNSLFVARKCPNGKEAHVSWNFCPWDGTPLPK